MNKKQPLVSVIMPVYNGERFLRQAILSMMRQTYQNMETIVVDDGSTDRTWEILKSLKEQYSQKLRIYRLKQNRGETYAANVAFKKARGPFIARMDADDVARLDRIEKQVQYMESHPRVVVLGGQARTIDHRGRSMGKKGVPLEHETIYTMFAFYQPIIHPAVMFRRSLLPKREYLYLTDFELANDYHTYFELLNYGEFHNLPDELVSYRVHGNNKSLSRLKAIFWNDNQIRFLAVKKLHYKASFLMFPAIAVQSMIVYLLPESLLRSVFFLIRGITAVNKQKTAKPKRTPVFRPAFALPTR